MPVNAKIGIQNTSLGYGILFEIHSVVYLIALPFRAHISRPNKCSVNCSLSIVIDILLIELIYKIYCRKFADGVCNAWYILITVSYTYICIFQ
jgi:hypothetical protein